MSNHEHAKTDELCMYWVPADTDIPMEFKSVASSIHAVIEMMGGYIEQVRTEYMPELPCGCRMVMLVDEEGRLKGLPRNSRAGIYYPYAEIAGDAYLVGEGFVDGELDWFSLPQSMSHWQGPGNPITVNKQPWEK